MTKLTFIEGQKVRHLKTGNIYIIESTDHMQCDDRGEWKPAVIYRPANSTPTTFSRTAASFSESFANA